MLIWYIYISQSDDHCGLGARDNMRRCGLGARDSMRRCGLGARDSRSSFEGWRACPLSWLFTVPVQLLGHVRLFVSPWIAAHQASLSFAISWSLIKLMSTESTMPSKHLILCCPLLLPPSVFPSIRVFSSESALHIRWPKYWSFSFSISPFNECSGLW